MSKSLNDFLNYVKARNPNEPEFLQTVEEVTGSVWDYVQNNSRYKQANILERIVEPERTVSFRVVWLDDKNNVQVNKGYRVQFNSAIGPYKGGLRFHPTVNLSVLKFLGFEQTFKNSLTGLPMGGGKGGADFDPKGKTDVEVMKFCQAFMNELYRHIGPNLDVPAGDMNVAGREIGYLFGQYKRLKNEFTGVFTGKGYNWGGSLIRPEATGYGLLYFVQEALALKGEQLKNKTILVSGAGNVAQYAVEKAIQFGCKVLTMSDSDGTIYDPDGFDPDKLSYVMRLKNIERGRISKYATKFKKAKYLENRSPWKNIKADIALPCATQNELDIEDAKVLVKNKVMLVAEGANMPSTNKAIELFTQANIPFGPSKACNAGGVATSGLEMTQNSIRLQWSRDEVDEKLRSIMQEIHHKCVEYGKEGKRINYLKGANLAGFIKVADAMLDQGIV